MDPNPTRLIPSGIEPVDNVLGGLEAGDLYLVHGEGSSKSLFGIRFLIEGLKRGEHATLIINYSPEDAVRRFARIGYDCLEDVYSARLVILECAEDNIRQISQMNELTPVLRELRWLMGESTPDRIVFEPIAKLIAGEPADTGKRAREFAEWALTTGATSLLITNGNSAEVTEAFRPLVKESFRFEIREHGDRATRYLVFENSPTVPDQPIEVDPTRGIFLLDRGTPRYRRADLRPEPNRGRAAVAPPAQAAQSSTPAPVENGAGRLPELELPPSPIPNYTGPSNKVSSGAGSSLSNYTDENGEVFPDLIDELVHQSPPREQREEETALIYSYQEPEPASRRESWAPAAESRMEHIEARPVPHTTVPEVQAAEAVAETEEQQHEMHLHASTAEDLLRPPVSRVEYQRVAAAGRIEHAQEPGQHEKAHTAQTQTEASVPSPGDFTVLVISGDSGSSQRILRALGEYKLDTSDDPVTGLARLISLKPDLVVLDIDVQTIDGFKLLGHIRINLDVPIIVVSSSHVRASDRIRATELGADYFLTKPFAIKELRQKSRQLIARYRHIEQWIIHPQRSAEPESGHHQEGRESSPKEPHFFHSSSEDPHPMRRAHDTHLADQRPTRETARPGRYGRRKADRPPEAPEPANGSNGSRLVSYGEFVKKVESKVKDAIETDTWFSIVGCRLPASGSEASVRHLSDIIPDLVRDRDLVSINHAKDLVIILTDADAIGARSFSNRLHDRVVDEFNVEPIIWTRTFPTLDSNAR